MTDPERRLRDMFGALRSADQRAAPPFGAVVERARRRKSPRARRVAAGVVLALAAAAVLLLVWRVGSGHEPVAFVYPTDFLLDMPGAQLLRTVPELGAIPEVRLN